MTISDRKEPYETSNLLGNEVNNAIDSADKKLGEIDDN